MQSRDASLEADDGARILRFCFSQSEDANKAPQKRTQGLVNRLEARWYILFPIYNLRHTFATRLAAVGASPIVVAHLLGHSNASIVMTYASADDATKREAVLKLDELRQKAFESADESLVQ